MRCKQRTCLALDTDTNMEYYLFEKRFTKYKDGEYYGENGRPC